MAKMAKIRYAVIAPKKHEIDKVVQQLKADKMDVIGHWLEQNKDDLYGKRSEDWKPFGDSSIEELMKGSDDYESSTPLIDAITDDREPYTKLSGSGITIYFVDLFALFLPKYSNLAGKLDWMLAEREGRACCFVMSYGLSQDVDKLLSKYFQQWELANKDYTDGSLHRMAMRSDDLKNFRNYIRGLPRDPQNADLKRQLNERFGADPPPLPRM